MQLFAQRRIIAGTALLAFLFAVAFPVLAVARHAMDPLADVTICRVDNGFDDKANAPLVPAGRTQSAHCLMCLATASPPPAVLTIPVVVTTVADFVLPMERGPFAARYLAALQPLNPRAPPRA